MHIIPGILESSNEAFITSYNAVSFVTNHFQIDIADGILVGNTTITTLEAIEQLSSICHEGHSFEFHLMMDNPKVSIDALKSCDLSVTRILLHKKPFSHQSSQGSIPLGLVINPEDDVDMLQANELSTTSIQIM